MDPAGPATLAPPDEHGTTPDAVLWHPGAGVGAIDNRGGGVAHAGSSVFMPRGAAPPAWPTPVAQDQALAHPDHATKQIVRTYAVDAGPAERQPNPLCVYIRIRRAASGDYVQ